MKLSKLAQIYDRLQQATREPERVKILSDLFRKADKGTLEALAHLTVGEVVDPQLVEELGIGPGRIRAALSKVSGKDEADINERVKQTGDMSEVVAEFSRGRDLLTVDSLWERVNRAVKR